MPFESRISRRQPCFPPSKNIQFKNPKCFSRSTLVDMKLRVFRMFFSLFLASVLATGLAVAQSSTPSTGDKSGIPPDQAAKGTDASAPGQTGNQQVDPLKRPQTEKQKKASSKALKQELSSTYKKWLNEDVRYIMTPEEMSAFNSFLTTRSVTSLSNSSGCAAIRLLTRRRTNSRKSTTAALPTRTNISRLASRGGEPTAGAFISYGAHPTRLTLIPRVAASTARWKKAVARLPPIPSRTGATATSRELARRSTSSLSTPARAATIT